MLSPLPFLNHRAIFAALLSLVSGCVYMSRHTPEGACETARDSPVRNFCVVDPGTLWRGENPTTADVEWLLEQGVQSVLSIQLDARPAFERAALRPEAVRSVSYFRVKGFDPLQMLSRSRDDRVVALFIAVVEEAPKPLYVHCRAGVDRVGVLVASYRIIVQGVSREDAVAEMARFQSPWLPLERRYLLGLSEARQREILRDVEDWKTRLKPFGRFDCQRGLCHFVPDPQGEIARP